MSSRRLDGCPRVVTALAGCGVTAAGAAGTAWFSNAETGGAWSAGNGAVWLMAG
jgi:hypothetical protein